MLLVYQFELLSSAGLCSKAAMTARQYSRVESLLAQADDVTMEHALLTPEGRRIQNEIRALLKRVVAEKLRAEERDKTPGPTPPVS